MTPRVHGTGRIVLARLTVFLIAGILPGAAARPARAQWYPGDFWGNPFLMQPSQADIDTQTSLDRIAHAAQQGTPMTSFRMDRNTRDADFFERYDIETRRAMEDRVARRPSRASAPTGPAVTSAPARPAVTSAPELVAPLIPIASFFNAARQLVWPGDAPTQGDFGPKRTASDEACLAVKEEVSQKGAAPISTVTDARTKLLDYGKPALDFLRGHSTPPISETFHMFLLSLYDSLGQSANRRTASGS
jgi:hypothetical protein